MKCLVVWIALLGIWNANAGTLPQTLHISHLGEIETFDPAKVRSRESFPIVLARFETLYQYDPEKAKPTLIPSLASDFPKISADGLVVTLPLRADARFRGQNRALTPADVIYTLKRLADPQTASPGWWLFEGKISGLDAFRKKLADATTDEARAKIYGESVSGLKPLKPNRIEIRLSRKYPQFMHALASLYSAPVTEISVANGFKTGETGPYYLKEWDRGHRLHLERNPEFHAEFIEKNKPIPQTDIIDVKIVKSEPEAWALFEKRELDIVGGTLFYNADRLEKQISNGATVRMNQQSPTYFILLNHDHPLLKNQKIRQALSSVIDRKKWIELANPGFGTPQTSLLPIELNPEKRPASLPFDFDTKKAELLFAQAKSSISKGELSKPMRLIIGSEDQVSQRVGSYLKRTFEALGLSVELGLLPLNDQLARLEKKDFELALVGWSLDYPHPRSLLRLFFGPNRKPGGPNDSSYENPAFDKEYEKAVATENSSELARSLRRLEKILFEDCAFLPGYHHTTAYVAHPKIKNFKRSEFRLNDLKTLTLN